MRRAGEAPARRDRAHGARCQAGVSQVAPATTPADETTSTMSRVMLEMALDLNLWLESFAPRLDL